MARASTAAVRLLSGEREPVRVATTANITLSGLQTIDGVTVVAGDRVLVKDQSDATENGIYDASAGAWYRSSDARQTRTINKGVTVRVQSGTANGGRSFKFDTLNPDIGDDEIDISDQTNSFDDLEVVTDLTVGGNLAANYLPTHGSAVARAIRTKLSEVVSVLDFGADNTGVATCNSHFNLAIATANATGKNIYIPAGFYKITAALNPITNSGVRVYGDGPVNTRILVKGSPGGGGTAVISFVGGSTTGPGGGVWLYGCGISDLMFQCDTSLMTDGDCVKADCVWDFSIERVWMEEPFNGIYARQYNTLRIRDVRIQNTKGSYCFRGYGTGATRNGIVDRCDALYLDSIIFTSNQPVSNAAGIWLDGFCHTIQGTNLVLWYLGRAIYTTNTPAVAGTDGWPSFFFIQDMEIEQARYGGVVFSASGQEIFFGNIYIWGVTEGEGIAAGVEMRKVSLACGKVETCDGSGLSFENVQGLSVNGIWSFSNGSHGLYLGNSSDVVMLGESAFYDNAGRGIAANSATKVLAQACATWDNGSANNGTITAGNSFV